MRVMVLGGRGQLGRALADTLPDGYQCVSLDVDEVDITDQAAIERVVQEWQPDFVVNAAAYTAVDRAESEPERSRLVNVVGAGNVARAVDRVGARLVFVSTDFVFDGRAEKPYGPHAKTNPLSVYGTTKRDGELATQRNCAGGAVVLRTAWLYGEYGTNFARSMLRLMRDRDRLAVVDDQTGTPTWTHSLATVVWSFSLQPRLSGTYHWTDGGRTTWYGFADAIREEALSLGILRRDVVLNAISAADYAAAASRPAFSVLDTGSTTDAVGIAPVPWRANLREALKRIKRLDG